MSDSVLPIKLRPKSLDELLGAGSLVKAIRSQIAQRPPRAWMFSGPSGTGKTTIARIVAMSYQCSHQSLWGNPCRECQDRLSEFQIVEINASEVNGVEEIGKIATSSHFKPIHPSRCRVYILDECQMLTGASQNLLLKHFEDAPSTTVWIICTTVPAKVIATLKRRCISYSLRPLSVTATEKLVQKALGVVASKLPASPLIEELCTNQVLSPAAVLMAVEKYASGLSPEESIQSDLASVNSLRVCKAASDGDWLALRKELKTAAPEDARLLRQAVAGWFRGWLLKESDPKKQRLLAENIDELMSICPLEDSPLSLWLTAKLFRICKRMKAA